MKTTSPILLLLALVSGAIHAEVGTRATPGAVFVRTESYPRPPYSGATYYFYERDGRPICTKLQVCNKYQACAVDYRQGWFKEAEDVEPFDATPPTPIPAEKLGKHRCLTRFGLLK